MEVFLQSKAWEDFQHKIGRDTFRINGKLFIRLPLPLGKTYLYCPRCDFSDKKLETLLSDLKKYLEPTDIFVRIEPLSEVRSQKSEVRFYKCPSVQPKNTLILDLAKNEEELLAAMKPKTRYNIRLAQKKEVRIEKSEVSSFDKVWNLMQETAKRDKFSIYSKDYYQKMLEVLGKDKLAHLLVTKHEKDILSAMILITYGDQAIYLHGASSNIKRNLMSPYLMQWEAIKFAKNQGCKTYDFWGIRITKDGRQKTENTNLSSELDGVTRFKLGFGGQIVKHPGCFEVPIDSNLYQGFRLLRFVNRVLKPRTFE